MQGPSLFVVGILVGCSGAQSSLSEADAGVREVEASVDTGIVAVDGAVEGAVDGAKSCAPATLTSAAADWIFVVDRSTSWSSRLDRFSGMKEGATTFLAERGDAIGLGLLSFPRAGCAAADFESLDAEMGTKRANIASAIELLVVDGAGALGPAIAGATVSARAWQAAHRDRVTSLVVMTDATPGESEACVADWPGVAALAGEAFGNGTGSSVQVNVVSVMGSAVSPDHFARLGALAEAGGGYAAFVNGSHSDVAASTTSALRDMHDRVGGCSYALNGASPPLRIELSFSDGTTQVATRVASAAECTTGEQFYLDDELAPRRATLCSGTGGIGGYCQLTFLRARMTGAPTVRALCE